MIYTSNKFSYNEINSEGFIDLPSNHSSKCKCGPEDNSPVSPIIDIISPVLTSWPDSTNTLELCL